MGVDALRKNPTPLLILLLLPVFAIVSLASSNTYDAHRQDFAAYWQAGHMILHGEDVYDSPIWTAERERLGTALHSEPAFHYPLPFAVLFSPLALLPVQTAYTLWLFFQQTALLISTVLLLRMSARLVGYFTIFAVAGVFLFRPAFSVIFNGQILSALLLAIVLSIQLFRVGRWFWGGLLFSTLLLKPSLGVPILIFASLWLLSLRQGRGIAGLAAGGIVLFLMGAVMNPAWVHDYLLVGLASFSKYVGLQPTLWGLAETLPVPTGASRPIGIMLSLVVTALESMLIWRVRFDPQPLPALSSILPAGLLVAPYSWNYDQILLVVPLIYLAAGLAERRGAQAGLSLLFGMVILSVVLVLVAYSLLYDVWSVLNPLAVWSFVLISWTRAGKAGINVTP